MSGQEVAQRNPSRELVSQVRSDEFQQQVALALPEGVRPARFVRAAVTALMQNPDLANADRESVFASLIRAATDGLLPDGREAAIVLYKGKAGYIPMIGGARKILAEYGWTLRTQVVYANDDFDYSEEPPALRHQPVRPGQERGELVAAYAIATHRDGRRLQVVLHPDDIAKRRAKAQTQAVWNEWTAAMWEKTAGHQLARDVPLSEADRKRLDRIADVEPHEAADLLYGPDGERYRATPALPAGTRPAGGGDVAAPSTRGDVTGSGGQQADGAPQAAADAPAVPGDDDEEPQLAAGEQTKLEIPEKAINEAAAVEVPRGSDAVKGKPLSAIAADENGPTWLAWALRRASGYWTDGFRANLELFVEHRVPDVWAQYAAEREAD